MSNKSILAQMCCLIFAVVIFTQCNAQEKNNETKVWANTGVKSKSPADEAKIVLNIPNYEIKEINLKCLQSIPIPNVLFVFESQSTSKVDLPVEASYIIAAHWKEHIKYLHEKYLNNSTDAKTYHDKMKAWSNYSEETSQKLQKIIIEAPNGRRNISDAEASAIVGFMNQASLRVIEEAKRLK